MRNYWQATISALAVIFAPATALADDAKVEVGHGSLDPAEVTITPGDTITFTNTKKMPGGHTIVLDGLDAQSDGLAKGKSWSHTFKEPGEYNFRVKEHPDKAGTVTVKPSGT